MKYSTTEQLTLNYLNNSFGAIREALPYIQVTSKLESAKVRYQYQVEQYAQCQSAFNYNRLVEAMVQLQYWNQKRISQDSLVEKAMGE